MAPLPDNLANALPNQVASPSVPQSVIDALPGGANTLAQGVTDSLPFQGGFQNPDVMRDALPIADIPPIPPTEQLEPVQDLNVPAGWDGWDGAAPVAFPNVYTTIDEFPFSGVDYARETPSVAAGGTYNFRLRTQVSSIAKAIQELRFSTGRTGTTGVYSLIVELANNPGLTFFSTTISDAALRSNTNFSFFLTAGQIAARTSTSIIVGLALSGGPPGGDSGEIRIGGFRLFVTL